MLASLKGSGEIGFTIVSMTLSLAAVFIPVLFLGGVLGRLFKEFAVTICVAILISGVVSVTLTPMLCSRFLRAAHACQARLVLQRHREVSSTACCASTTSPCSWRCATARHDGELRRGAWPPPCYMFVKIPKGFIPDQDTDQMHVITEAAQGTSFYQMVRVRTSRSPTRCPHDPNVEVADGQRRRHHRLQPRRPQLRRAGGPPEAARASANWASTTSSRNCAPSWPPSRHRNLPAESARPSTSAARSPRACTSSPCSRPIRRSSTRRPKASTKEVEKLPGVEDVTSDVAITTPQVNVDHRPRQSRRHERQRQPDRKRALRRLRPALGLHHLRLHQRIQSAAGTGAAVSGATRARSRCSISRTPTAS